jgi:hypothetical protein
LISIEIAFAHTHTHTHTHTYTYIYVTYTAYSDTNGQIWVDRRTWRGILSGDLYKRNVLSRPYSVYAIVFIVLSRGLLPLYIPIQYFNKPVDTIIFFHVKLEIVRTQYKSIIRTTALQCFISHIAIDTRANLC